MHCDERLRLLLSSITALQCARTHARTQRHMRPRRSPLPAAVWRFFIHHVSERAPHPGKAPRLGEGRAHEARTRENRPAKLSRGGGRCKGENMVSWRALCSLWLHLPSGAPDPAPHPPAPFLPLPPPPPPPAKSTHDGALNTHKHTAGYTRMISRWQPECVLFWLLDLQCWRMPVLAGNLLPSNALLLHQVTTRLLYTNILQAKNVTKCLKCKKKKPSSDY